MRTEKIGSSAKLTSLRWRNLIGISLSWIIIFLLRGLAVFLILMIATVTFTSQVLIFLLRKFIMLMNGGNPEEKTTPLDIDLSLKETGSRKTKTDSDWTGD